ncbi:MAG: efflux RND transporter periplasmic adaptor subunit [Actinomycetota bacterium]|nr:MAG: HlyD family secretion [Actinomycetota bacterium]MDO8949499.1 efflux RND transporter periplasmic adaptor subunit [Actinomycetota bacterium]MDP3630220.1 efflux RND transporter periplasmic adaptor subunit [Actinomycetota bacterium]
MKRIIPIVLVLAVIGVAAWYFLLGGKASSAPAGLGGSGTVETDTVVVSPQSSGRIIEAPSEDGVPVKKGDVLYKLDPAMADLQVQQAEAGVAAAQAAYQQAIDDDKTKAEIAAAKAQLDQAKVAVAMAKVQRGYMTISSPIDGVLTNVVLKAGENALPGSTLAVVSNPASLTVTVYVPENQIGQVKTGQAGTLTTDSLTKEYGAVVVFIGSQAEYTPASIETKDQRTKLVYKVRLRITDADSALKPGMPADVVLR